MSTREERKEYRREQAAKFDKLVKESIKKRTDKFSDSLNEVDVTKRKRIVIYIMLALAILCFTNIGIHSCKISKVNKEKQEYEAFIETMKELNTEEQKLQLEKDAQKLDSLKKRAKQLEEKIKAKK